MNKKKKIVILTIVLLAILIVIGGVIAILNTKERNELYNTVVSVITLDINPSIKLELNKDNKVINMIALNEDAKDIVLSNYEGNSLESVINDVTNKLIEKGYAQDKLVILVGTSGTITSDEVKEKNGKLIHKLEIDFFINVDSTKINVKLSNEHCDYKWLTKDSSYLDDFIKTKLSNI